MALLWESVWASTRDKTAEPGATGAGGRQWLRKRNSKQGRLTNKREAQKKMAIISRLLMNFSFQDKNGGVNKKTSFGVGEWSLWW